VHEGGEVDQLHGGTEGNGVRSRRTTNLVGKQDERGAKELARLEEEVVVYRPDHVEIRQYDSPDLLENLIEAISDRSLYPAQIRHGLANQGARVRHDTEKLISLTEGPEAVP